GSVRVAAAPVSPRLPSAPLFRSGELRLRFRGPGDDMVIRYYVPRRVPYEPGSGAAGHAVHVTSPEIGHALAGVNEHHGIAGTAEDRKSTRLNSSHVKSSYAVFSL